MNRSPEIGKLAAALAKAQGAIKGAIKDARNPHFNSRYADLATIREACREPLAANEIAVVQSPTADAGLVRLTTMLIHSSGEWIESDPLQVQGRDAAPQAVGSCITYLLRYQLAALVGIAPEDDDAEAGEGRTVGSQPAARPQAPARPPFTPVRQAQPQKPNGAPRPTPPPPARTEPLTDDDIPF